MSEQTGVGDALVAQRVALGDHDHRGHRAGEVAREQGRDPRVRMVAEVTEVALIVLSQALEVQEVPRAESVRGVGDEFGAERRIDQDLGHESKVLSAQLCRRDGGEVGAGGVPHHDESRVRVGDVAPVGRDVADHVHRVLEPRREGVFGRQAVLDGEESQPGIKRQASTEPVVGLQIPHHETAAVEVDHQRRRLLLLGHVEPSPQGSTDEFEGEVLDRGQRGRLTADRGGLVAKGPSSRLRRERCATRGRRRGQATIGLECWMNHAHLLAPTLRTASPERSRDARVLA